jgi:uncharacterized protein
MPLRDARPPTTAVPPPAQFADPVVLRHSLDVRGAAVDVRETGSAFVFLVGDRAYKLRKAGVFGRVDWRTGQARSEAARRDVDLNASLAPGIALGVRAVVPIAGGEAYALAAADDAGAVDHVVEMHRYAEADTLAVRAREGTVTQEQLVAAGGRVAAFHHHADRRRAGVDYRELIDRNFEALLPLAESLVPAGERLALQRFAAAFLLEWHGVLEARARHGSVVDGHGDLRAEHVLCEAGGTRIVERLETDALRVVDVADELAFLLMELVELTGGPTAGDTLLRAYTAAGGAPQPDALLAFFGAYRAQVRATVALVRATQAGADPEPDRAHARRLLALSRRLGWQARGPLLILVTGPAAVGKTALAEALGRASGFPVLALETLGRDPSALSPRDRAHDRSVAYAELGRRASRERAAIVDAAFGDAVGRRAFTEQLADGGGSVLLVVECHAPAARPSRGHDMTAAALACDETGVAHLAVDTRAPVSAQVDEVASWMDARLAAGGEAYDPCPRSAAAPASPG